MNIKNKEVLVIIDPQNDFMDSPNYHGSLAVNGAYNDMLNIITKIKTNPPEHIIVTLDTHAKMHIAHSLWWVDSDGNNPEPFTLITIEDVLSKKWKAAQPDMQEHSINYVSQLEKQNKYELRIWPFHCIEFTQGHKVESNLAYTLEEWEYNTGKHVHYVNKGTNPKTEHYSVFKAEVIILEDENTKLNTSLINEINSYDIVSFAGEASSHCVAGSVLDYLDNVSEIDRLKVQVLADCMSPVNGYEKTAEKFFQTIKDLGVNIIKVREKRKYKI